MAETEEETSGAKLPDMVARGRTIMEQDRDNSTRAAARANGAAQTVDDMVAPPVSMPPVDTLGQPTGEMRAYKPSFSESISNWLQQGLISMGAHPYMAGHIARGLTSIGQLTPLGMPMAAGDMRHSMNEGDMAGTAINAAGAMIPGARAVGTAAREATSVARAGERELASRRYPGMSPAQTDMHSDWEKNLAVKFNENSGKYDVYNTQTGESVRSFGKLSEADAFSMQPVQRVESSPPIDTLVTKPKAPTGFAKQVVGSAEQAAEPALASAGASEFARQDALLPPAPPAVQPPFTGTVDQLVQPVPPGRKWFYDTPEGQYNRYQYQEDFRPGRAGSYARVENPAPAGPPAPVEDIPLSRTQEAQIVGGVQDRMDRRKWYFDGTTYRRAPEGSSAPPPNLIPVEHDPFAGVP